MRLPLSNPQAPPRALRLAATALCIGAAPACRAQIGGAEAASAGWLEAQLRAPELAVGGWWLVGGVLVVLLVLLTVAIVWNRSLKREVEHRTAELRAHQGSLEDLVEERTAELGESEAKYRSLFDNAQVGIFQLHVPSARFLKANRAMARMFGYESGEEMAADYRPRERDDERQVWREAREDLLADGEVRKREIRLRRKDGSIGWFEYSGKLDGDVMTGVAEDVTARKGAQKALESSEERFRLLVQNASDVIWVTDATGRLTWVSPSIEHVTGHRIDECLGKELVDRVHFDDSGAVRSALAVCAAEPGATTRVQFRLRHADGSWIYLDAIATNLIAVDSVRGIVANARDVTDRVLAEQALDALSRQDSLTRLANRRAFEEHLAREWRRSSRIGKPLSLVMADIDGFKAFNDAFGHLAGDECLRRVAQVIADTFQRAGDFPARWGGEEFSVVVAESDAADGEACAERLRVSVERAGISRDSDGTSVVTVSVGVATALPSSNLQVRALAEAADQALYAAKSAGRNRVVARVVGE